MKEEKIVNSVLYATATAELTEEVKKELKEKDPPKEAVAKILETFQYTVGEISEDTEEYDRG